MNTKLQKVDTLILCETQLYNSLSSIRQEILEINQLISMTDSAFDLRSECNSLREEFAALNHDLVLVDNQLKIFKKEKSTSRQESTYRTFKVH